MLFFQYLHSLQSTYMYIHTYMEIIDVSKSSQGRMKPALYLAQTEDTIQWNHLESRFFLKSIRKTYMMIHSYIHIVSMCFENKIKIAHHTLVCTCK